MALSPTPLRKEPELRNSIPPAEWAARIDLAAAYRYAQYAGWNDLIFNHITLRVPGRYKDILNFTRADECAPTSLRTLNSNSNFIQELTAVSET